MKTLSAALLVVLSFFPLTSASAQTDQPRLYFLKAGSTFDTGCFGPCLCPIIEQPMQGTFQLLKSGVDPLFTHYDVKDVRWTLPNTPQNVAIVGSGTYKVGGEFAVQHQMVLDLSVGGGPAQHFDSGLILGGGTFPDIDIRLSLHGQQACIDTVLHVLATPATATSSEGSDAAVLPGIRAVTPSPFRDQVRLVLGVSSTDRVEVVVFDARGRLVRNLAEGRWGAGDYPITWDGRTDGGEECGAGIYLVRATIGDRHFVARLVRVR
jgi:flagellar hook capping protein FlgD